MRELCILPFRLTGEDSPLKSSVRMLLFLWLSLLLLSTDGAALADCVLPPCILEADVEIDTSPVVDAASGCCKNLIYGEASDIPIVLGAE